MTCPNVSNGKSFSVTVSAASDEDITVTKDGDPVVDFDVTPNGSGSYTVTIPAAVVNPIGAVIDILVNGVSAACRTVAA